VTPRSERVATCDSFLRPFATRRDWLPLECRAKLSIRPPIGLPAPCPEGGALIAPTYSWASYGALGPASI
jgi:hypothetical protein